MLPFQQRGELSWQTTDDNAGDQDQSKVEDQIWMDNAATSSIHGVGSINPLHLVNNNNRGRRSVHTSSLLPHQSINNNNDDDDDDDKEKRKMIRRDVERQRRQEMSQLFTSLRSTLPHEYTKGKRCASDYLEEAVNYIKEMEENVKQLSIKRDKLKVSKELTNSRHGAGGSSNSTGSVVLVPRQGGLDIEISVVYEEDGFCLSRALQVVFQEGLSVASCTSTHVGERLMHHILCEVSDMASIDVNRLQQRLTDLVC